MALPILGGGPDVTAGTPGIIGGAQSVGIANKINSQPSGSNNAPVITTNNNPPANTGPTAAQLAASALQTKLAGLIGTGTSSAISGGVGGTAQAHQGIVNTGSTAVAQEGGQQNTIDNTRKDIGITQINSIKQLLNTLHEGLFGTGVQLGNTGALSSSARDAASRAYANYDNVQTNAANNTAAVANQDQDTQQANLELLKSASKTQLDAARDAGVTAVTAKAQADMQALKTQILYSGGDPNSVPAKDTQDTIIQQAQADLAQIDKNYQDMLNGIHPMTSDQIATNAVAGSNAGVVPSSGTPVSSTGIIPPSAATTQAGAPAPSLIPLTLGQVGSNKTQAPGF